MAFVNEYISDEDMEKYKIIDVYKAFNPRWDHVNEEIMNGNYSWTIDKERNIYFIPMGSGRFEASHHRFCVLWWKGTLLSVTIAKVGGKVNYIERTGSCVWDLLNIGTLNGLALPNAEIIPTLKEVLIVYQDSGILTPMKEYQVTFNF